jgi:hypothetical protein
MQPPNNYPNYNANYYGPIPAPPFPPKPRLPWKPRLLALCISLLIYALACALPVLDFSKSDWSDSSEGPVVGYVALVSGWLLIAIGQFAWLANFLWLISWILLLFRCWIASLVMTILTTLLALQTYSLFAQKVPGNEAATYYLTLQEVKIGFYVWLASFLAVGISALLLRSRERALRKNAQFLQPPHTPYQAL